MNKQRQAKVIMRGILKQRGMFSTWKKYHFVLLEGVLYKYKSETSEKEEEGIKLKGLDSSNFLFNAQTLCGKKNSFAIIQKGKSPLILLAQSEQDYKNWTSCIGQLFSTPSTGKPFSNQTVNTSYRSYPNMSTYPSFCTNTNTNTYTTEYVMSDVSHTEKTESEGAEQDIDSMILMMEAILDSTVIIDITGSVIGYNDAAEKLFGYTREEIIGNNVKLLMPSSIAIHHDQYLKNYSKTGKKKLIGIPRNLPAQRKDGSSLQITISLGTSNTSQGKIFIAVIREVPINSSEKGSHSEAIVPNGMQSSMKQRLELDPSIQGSMKTYWQFQETFLAKMGDINKEFKQDMNKCHQNLEHCNEKVQNILNETIQRNNNLMKEIHQVQKTLHDARDEIYLLSDSLSYFAISNSIASILRVDIVLQEFLDFCKKERSEESLLYLQKSFNFKKQYKRLLKGSSLSEYVKKTKYGAEQDIKEDDSTSGEEKSNHRDSVSSRSSASSAHVHDPVQTLTSLAMNIYHSFLEEQSSNQVNIGGTLVQDMLSKLKDPTNLKDSVFDCIDKDVMFTLEPVYKKFHSTERGKSLIEMLYILDPLYKNAMP